MITDENLLSPKQRANLAKNRRYLHILLGLDPRQLDAIIKSAIEKAMIESNAVLSQRPTPALARGLDGKMYPVSSDAVKLAVSEQIPYSEALQRILTTKHGKKPYSKQTHNATGIKRNK